jgi:hypothetical protein
MCVAVGRSTGPARAQQSSSKRPPRRVRRRLYKVRGGGTRERNRNAFSFLRVFDAGTAGLSGRWRRVCLTTARVTCQERRRAGVRAAHSREVRRLREGCAGGQRGVHGPLWTTLYTHGVLGKRTAPSPCPPCLVGIKRSRPASHGRGHTTPPNSSSPVHIRLAAACVPPVWTLCGPDSSLFH